MNLDPARIMASIRRSGYAHVCRSIPKSDVETFCQSRDLAVMDDTACFTWTIRQAGFKESVTIESLRAQIQKRRKR